MNLKNIVAAAIMMFLVISGHLTANAQEHSTPKWGDVVNVQMNLCNLNEGYTIEDYDKMNEEYFKWSRKNDVEVTYVRQTPLFTHNFPNNPDQYEFSDLLFTDYETSGKAWDKWLGTQSGQSLNAKWQKIAACDVKFMAMYIAYVDMEIMNASDERIVSYDFCTPLEGVTADEVNAFHEKYLQQNKDQFEQSAWVMLVPSVGLSPAGKGFFHLNAYQDLEAYQKSRKILHAGEGWRTYLEYQDTIASCNGDAVFQETVMNSAPYKAERMGE
tara:strand:- start:115 stop:927 length:813 start_codon:yes stop_codon:yes gene_type:complete